MNEFKISFAATFIFLTIVNIFPFLQGGDFLRKEDGKMHQY